MESVLILIVLIAVGAAGGYLWLKAETKKKAQQTDWARQVQRAERAVEASDPVTRQILDVLRDADSPFYQDAVALRRRQVEQGKVD